MKLNALQVFALAGFVVAATTCLTEGWIHGVIAATGITAGLYVVTKK